VATNPFFTATTGTQGSINEQSLLAELIEESIQIWGQNFYYIPRQLVAKDEILGEDRLSRFKDAYPIELYVETHDGFIGQNEFVSKFGLYVEAAIQVTMSAKRWHELIGHFGNSLLQVRPAEGDLLYYPVMKKLFEIKWVDKNTNFFQLGSLPMFKMTIELFQYSSERIETGIPAIDAFQSLKSFDTAVNEPGVDNTVNYGNNNKFIEESENIIWDENNPFNE